MIREVNLTAVIHFFLMSYTPCILLYTIMYQSNVTPCDVFQIFGLVANSVDSDQTPLSAASDLSLHCLLRRGVLWLGQHC